MSNLQNITLKFDDSNRITETFDGLFDDEYSYPFVKNYNNESEFDLIIISTICENKRKGEYYYDQTCLRLTEKGVGIFLNNHSMCFIKTDRKLITSEGLEHRFGKYYACVYGLYKNNNEVFKIFMDNNTFIINDKIVPFDKVAFAVYHDHNFKLHPFVTVCPLISMSTLFNAPNIETSIINSYSKIHPNFLRECNNFLEKIISNTLVKYESEIELILKDGTYKLYPYFLAHILDDRTPLKTIKGFKREPLVFPNVSINSMKVIFKLIIKKSLPRREDFLENPSLIEELHDIAEMLDFTGIKYYSDIFGSISQELSP